MRFGIPRHFGAHSPPPGWYRPTVVWVDSEYQLSFQRPDHPSIRGPLTPTRAAPSPTCASPNAVVRLGGSDVRRDEPDIDAWAHGHHRGAEAGGGPSPPTEGPEPLDPCLSNRPRAPRSCARFSGAGLRHARTRGRRRFSHQEADASPWSRRRGAALLEGQPRLRAQGPTARCASCGRPRPARARAWTGGPNGWRTGRSSPAPWPTACPTRRSPNACTCPKGRQSTM